MLKSGKRRGAKTKQKQTSCEPIQVSKIANQADISTYLLKLDKDQLWENGQLPEVPVPCPDDAALPSSTCLGSISNKKEKEQTLLDACTPNSETAIECMTTMKATVLTKKPNTKAAKTVNNENENGVVKKRSKKQEQMQNHQLTEFFPVRRSNRKTLCNVMKERFKKIEEAVLSGKEEGFEVKEFPEKGRGVIAIKNVKRGEFVMEYYGELIDLEEAKKRELIYGSNENTGCYMYYFNHHNKRYCIDATKETDRLGRLINHSKKGNLKTQSFFVQDSPRLIFLASKDIQSGEELLYDYGDRNKLSLLAHPWLAL